MLNATDVAWLAGLYEGEGSFSRQKTGKTSYSPRLDIAMTDKDIIKRVAVMVDRAVTKQTKVDNRYGKKQQWRTTLQGKAAMQLVMLMYPWLGDRRRSQVSEMWKNYKAMPGKNWAKGLTHKEMGR